MLVTSHHLQHMRSLIVYDHLTVSLLFHMHISIPIATLDSIPTEILPYNDIEQSILINHQNNR